MLDPSHPILELIREDKRFKFEAYAFVFESLNYAQEVLQMGRRNQLQEDDVNNDVDTELGEHHVSGQELCNAIRLLALEQFGYMAKPVLNSWGVRNTGDFGDIVFNLVRIGQMRKTDKDCREDFNNIYDFDEVFKKQFKITMPDDSE